MDSLQLDSAHTLITSLVVLYLGSLITSRVEFLRRYSIPQAVTGGLLVAVSLLIVSLVGGPTVEFDLRLRDLLLLAFFSTIGLSAKFSRLKQGGKPLIILLVCAAAFLVIQDVTGIAVVTSMGQAPGYGLFAGSISLAGGHGTAIAWGQEAAAAGLTEAPALGIAFATFGLIAGGIIGGPLAERLIKKHKIPVGDRAGEGHMMTSRQDPEVSLEPITTSRILQGVFVLAVCVSLGDAVNQWFFSAGVMLPGFLTAMMIGIAITNLADVFDWPIRQRDFDRTGEICLQLFLAMSLMSIDLLSLQGALGIVFAVLLVQILVISLFASLIVFRVMGRTYDAAVISSGFVGLGLGATPVAIANMSAVTSKYGSSFKAFLVVPLVGAFFIDLMNALVIKFFLGLPFMQASFG